jgi:DNA-directed RNA polymerase sigma subunit (sigma70/sigma32)
LIPANDERSAPALMIERAETSELRRLFKNLTPIQAEVLRKHFGLEGSRRLTLQAIADQHGLSRERIRQIEVSALKVLRTNMKKAEMVEVYRRTSAGGRRGDSTQSNRHR